MSTLTLTLIILAHATGVGDQPVHDSIRVGTAVVRILSVEQDQDQGDPVRRVPGFETRDYHGSIRRQESGELPFALGLESDQGVIMVVLYNLGDELISVVACEPECGGDDLPWNPDLELPLELESAQAQTLLIGEIEQYRSHDEAMLTLTLDTGSCLSWRIIVGRVEE